MIRNLGVIRAVRTVNGGQNGLRSLSTRQQQQKKEHLFDVDAYPAESGIICNSPFENITIPNLTLHQYVWNNFREWETKIAAVSFTYIPGICCGP